MDGASRSLLRQLILLLAFQAQPRGVELVLTAMRTYPSAETLQGWACLALRNLAVNTDSNQFKLMSLDTLEITLSLLMPHRGAGTVLGMLILGASFGRTPPLGASNWVMYILLKC